MVVLDKFEPDLHGVMTALDDLRDNFGELRLKAPRPTPTRWHETTNTSTVEIYSATACRRSRTSIAS